MTFLGPAPKQAVKPPMLKRTTSESGDWPGETVLLPWPLAVWGALCSGCTQREARWNLPWLLEVTARDRAQLAGKASGSVVR